MPSLLLMIIVQGPTIVYEGYSDLKGAWGVYNAERGTGPAAFADNASRNQQPRVFRLWKRQDGSDEEE